MHVDFMNEQAGHVTQETYYDWFIPEEEILLKITTVALSPAGCAHYHTTVFPVEYTHVHNV